MTKDDGASTSKGKAGVNKTSKEIKGNGQREGERMRPNATPTERSNYIRTEKNPLDLATKRLFGANLQH